MNVVQLQLACIYTPTTPRTRKGLKPSRTLTVRRLVFQNTYQHLRVVRQEYQYLQENPLAAFNQWVKDHAKEYVHDQNQFTRRFSIWKDNIYFIQEYNSMHTDHWVRLQTCTM